MEWPSDSRITVNVRVLLVKDIVVFWRSILEGDNFRLKQDKPKHKLKNCRIVICFLNTDNKCINCWINQRQFYSMTSIQIKTCIKVVENEQNCRRVPFTPNMKL